MLVHELLGRPVGASIRGARWNGHCCLLATIERLSRRGPVYPGFRRPERLCWEVLEVADTSVRADRADGGDMCFSAEADLTAGVLVGVVAVDALRHAHRPTQLPLALLPLVLALHQLVEAVVWWGLGGDVAPAVTRAAEWLYLVIAFGVVPLLVPVAVGVLEPRTHRPLPAVLVAVGALVAVTLTYAVVRGPVSASVQGHHIRYDVDLWHGGAFALLYVLATCGSMLISRYPQVRAYGMVNLGAVLVLAWLSRSGFVSLWCVWAAVTSVAIALHLRHAPQEPAAQHLTRV